MKSQEEKEKQRMEHLLRGSLKMIIVGVFLLVSLTVFSLISLASKFDDFLNEYYENKDKEENEDN